MKKKYFKTTCVMLAASMILSFTGCEKKAATIEGLSEEDAKAMVKEAQPKDGPRMFEEE